VFGDVGVDFLTASSLIGKIDPNDLKTHHLSEIRKLKEEKPASYKDFERNPIEWLKSWLTYNLVTCSIIDVVVGRNPLGFKISTGRSIIFVFHESYKRKFNQKIQKDLKKSTIILLNNAEISSRRKAISLDLSFKNLSGAQNLLDEILNVIQHSYSYESPQLVIGNEEHHFAKFINVKGKNNQSIISSVEFDMQSSGEYWRVGFLLGQNSSDNYEPFGTTGFPLIHLHKDIGEPNLKLTTYINGKHPPDTVGKILKMPAEGIFKVKIAINPSNIIRIFINGKSEYNNFIDSKYLNKVSILTWGDGKPEYKEVKILSYNYNEIY